MRGWNVWGLLLAVIIATAAPAAAQEKGDVGLTMGYPAAVGVIWHIADRIAIRPDVSMNWSSSESVRVIESALPGLPPITSDNSATSWSTSVGLSALVTLHTADRFRLYVVPRAAWLRTTIDLEDSVGGISGVSFDETTDGYVVSGALGAQVSAHERFAIFGELGVQYTEQRSSSTLVQSRSENENRTVGLRSAVGVVLYF
jgi:hypothetical protein